jgi:hypothetical protein
MTYVVNRGIVPWWSPTALSVQSSSYVLNSLSCAQNPVQAAIHISPPKNFICALMAALLTLFYSLFLFLFPSSPV